MREISNRRLLDETRLKEGRGSPTKKSCRKHSGELLQKRTCLHKRNQEREIRNSSSYDEELWPTSE